MIIYLTGVANIFLQKNLGLAYYLIIFLVLNLKLSNRFL